MLSACHGGKLRWSKEPWLCRKYELNSLYEDRRIGKKYNTSAMRSKLNAVHVLLIFNYHHPTGISKIGLSRCCHLTKNWENAFNTRLSTAIGRLLMHGTAESGLLLQ
jgi:hypothetical protein